MFNKIINKQFHKVKYKDNNKEIYLKTLKINYKLKNKSLNELKIT